MTEDAVVVRVALVLITHWYPIIKENAASRDECDLATDDESGWSSGLSLLA